MGLRSLAEEINSGMDEGCTSCGSLEEVLQAIAEASGLSEENLLEAVKCDSQCRAKYIGPDRRFKAGSGGKFKACEQMFKECCKGVKDPRRICAFIGRKTKRI